MVSLRPRLESPNMCLNAIYITLAQGYPCATPSAPTGEGVSGGVDLGNVGDTAIPAMQGHLFVAVR